MKSLFNRLAGVAVVGVVLYSCASIGRPEGGAIDETPPRFVGVRLRRARLIITGRKLRLNSMNSSSLRNPGRRS